MADLEGLVLNLEGFARASARNLNLFYGSSFPTFPSWFQLFIHPKTTAPKSKSSV